MNLVLIKFVRRKTICLNLVQSKTKVNRKKILGIILLFKTFDISSQIDTTKWSFMGMNGTDSIWVMKPTKGDLAREEGNYPLAIVEFKRAFNVESANQTILYNLACTYSIVKNSDSAFKYLNLALVKDSSSQVLTDPDFYNLVGDKRWSMIEEMQASKLRHKASRHKSASLSLAMRLWRIQMLDQALYSEIDITNKKYGNKSRQSDSLWKIKERINESNLVVIRKLLDTEGWPRKSEAGSAASAVFLVIQHSNDKTQKRYLSLLEKAFKAGEADWQDYALMKDRVLVSEKKPQLYGSQLTYDEKTQKYKLYPTADPKNVDKRRAKFGMMPLNIYVKQWEVEFNVPQNK
jgi:hypothetical protein